MPTTLHGIWTPSDSDDWDLTVDLAATANSIDMAINDAFSNNEWENYAGYLSGGFNVTPTGRYIEASRAGGLITIVGYIAGNIPSGSNPIVISSAIPADMRPHRDYFGVADSGGRIGSFQVGQNGVMSIGQTSGNSWSGAYISATYLRS